MKVPSRGHFETAKIPKLVWTLAGVGIGAGVLTMGIQFHALITVDQQRESMSVAEEQAASAIAALRSERQAIFQDMEAHLFDRLNEDRPAPRSPNSLAPFVVACQRQLASLEIDKARSDAAVHAMEQSVVSWSVLHKKLEQWDSDTNRTVGLLQDAWHDVESKLVEVRAATEKLEGRKRLRHQVVLRDYRSAAESEVSELAAKYIDGIESVRELRTLGSELTELSLLTQRLHAETQIDQLVSLKDNEIRPTLMRLRTAAETETLAEYIAELQDAIFGEGANDDEAHQTLVLGESGLFRFKLQSLSLDSEGRRLWKSLSTVLNECLEAEQAFDMALAAAIDVNASRSEAVFRGAWRNTLITGIVVVSIFLALAWRLARLGRQAEAELHTKNEELKHVNTRLEESATTDKLTGLPNRAVCVDRLDQMMKRSRRDGGQFAVLFFDFDRFKVVNDSLGHDVGDSLLCDIADIFRRELRESDTAARFGGDEFVVLLGNIANWEDARRKAEKLLDAFAVPHQLDDHLIVSTASIGLVTNKRNYKHPADMIRDADAAMYQAKENGKAQVVVFDAEMRADALDRLALEADLRSAVADEELRLVYQPIVDLESGEMTGFEALIRWEHPQRGVVSPVDFIPIAEDTGLIIEIGNWVLNTAAAQIADWNIRFRAKRSLTMNVNVSKRQLLDPSFLEQALECQSKYNLKSEILKLEITESTIADDRSVVVSLLRTLREHGFPIVMDDFGTGVSSLSTLHEYPLDVLKIDQAFIRVLDRDRSLLAVVSSITNLADNLGIKTVAEGVETLDIIGALQSINCTWGQGYYFARPMSREDAEVYIIEQQAATRAA